MTPHPHDRDEQADDEWGTGFCAGCIVGLVLSGAVWLLVRWLGS